MTDSDSTPKVATQHRHQEIALTVAEGRKRLEDRIRVVLSASRQDSDVSQRELAVHLGWTRNMIANLETGRRSVQLVDFVMIARALHVDPERLLHRILQW